MQSSQIERTLRGMLDAETRRALEEDERRAGKSRLAGLFRRKAPTAKAVKPQGKKGTAALPFSSQPVHPRSPRSDLVVAALGITLGLCCALFPWYIFMNQDEFGVRAMKFGGSSDVASGPIYLGDQGERVGAPMSAEDIPPMKLDLFATGTPSRAPVDGEASVVSIEDQPFPGDEINFELVYVANGRAMISDDTGLWVVQAGSKLPDNSRVSSIEQRSGKWVIVTSADAVVEQTPQ